MSKLNNEQQLDFDISIPYYIGFLLDIMTIRYKLNMSEATSILYKTKLYENLINPDTLLYYEDYDHMIYELEFEVFGVIYVGNKTGYTRSDFEKKGLIGINV